MIGPCAWFQMFINIYRFWCNGKPNISISALDAKGMRVAFVDDQVLMCPKGKTIDDATMIGEEDFGLYKLKGQPKQESVHESIEPSDLWNPRIAHVHYGEL